MQDKKRVSDVSIRYVKGVGPKRSVVFEKLGIYNISDLFYYLPRRYEDRSRTTDIKDLKPGEEHLIRGTVKKANVFTARTGTTIFEMLLEDATGKVHATWYNMPYIKKVFNIGAKVVLYGKVELYSHLQFVHPAYFILDPSSEDSGSLEVGRIVPVYPLTQDLSQKYMRKTVHSALEKYISRIDDALPTYIRARNKLVDYKFAAMNIHFPHSMDNLERAYKRLVFEEFFVLQVMMAMRRKKFAAKGIKHDIGEGLLKYFGSLFEFELTPDQKKCIRDIEGDMSSDRPMYRLLQGDVGSGKTVVAMYSMLLAAGGGYQSVLMAPTEVLARQHYITVSKSFMPLGLNIRLLINGLNDKDRTSVMDELKNGEIDILIGTHSVLQGKVEYKDLGLIIIDEQHKFGVEQRKALREKEKIADTLVMTATPIPRSLTMTVYGDMDISVLKSKPAERKPVVTYWVDEEKREGVYDFLKEELKKGRQAFIVCPRVKKEGKQELVSVEEMFEYLKGGALKDHRMELIHGQMKVGIKDKIMKDFYDRKIDVLISTTVIEVGVDIPNATVMIIEHADRYGLSQLHQLRGRIGRGKHTSYCILISEGRTDASQERLSTISQVEDGFQIAEKDLDLRGPGEFFGTRQSGLPELRLGNIVRDYQIMEEARKEAFDMVNMDPKLTDARHSKIKQSIVERFRGKADV